MNLVIPEGCGVCPRCNGTKRVPDAVSKWNPSGDRACGNCGGQTMYGQSQGYVRLRPDTNEPCLHQYTHTQLGRCYHGYTCNYCGHSYNIDSGD